MEKFNVTYFNVLLDETCVLIDGVTELIADEVVARFSNRYDPNNYLPEVKKQPA